MLKHEETINLLRSAKCGDNGAKETLLFHNSPLLKSLIRRFRNKGVEYEDLYQLACVGFLKAINNFNEIYNVQFSTYAVPMIIGEVKRFLRDDGAIKVSRSTKLLAVQINKFIEEYKKTNQESPAVKLIAEKFSIEESEVVFTLDSAKMPISLYERADDSQDNSLQLIDKLPDNKSQDEILERIDLQEVISMLSEREKKIILLRYYRDKTQGEIASLLGISQVQVSRLESKIIDKIKKRI